MSEGSFSVSMDFYDLMIDWKKRFKVELPFFKEFFGHQSSILDLACGVGRHALEFAKWGHTVKGIDVDSQMIAKATQQAKLQHIDHHITFETGSFEDLLDRKDLNDFSHIVCIGNSLSLIRQKEKLAILMDRLASFLKPGGQIIFQILNYDGLEAKLPYHILVNNDSGFFLRIYESMNSQQIRFTLIPILKSSEARWQPYPALESFLWKISSEELVYLLKDSKFTDIKLYGSYMKTEFTINSPYLLMVATQR
ncbi:MAG: class I SAM-dependent methyltransferase [Candidatus Hermodarchaeota archaeon]